MHKMRNLITIILILLSTISIAQNNYDFRNKSLICKQIKSATNYLRKDKDLKLRRIKYDSLIRDGWNYDIFAFDYVSYKLNITKEKVYENDSNETIKIYKKIENKNFNSGEILELKCLKKRRKPNAIISKLDEESLVIQVTEKRLGKEGSSGRSYLFLFENDKIKKVVEKGWIE